MGGRGSSSWAGGARAKENMAQYREAQLRTERTKVVKALRFINVDGSVTESMLEGGRWIDKKIPREYDGKISNIQFDPQIEKYSKMSTEALESELKLQQERSNGGYWQFTRRAASQSGSGLDQAGKAADEVSRIEQVITRRKHGVPQTEKVRGFGQRVPKK